MFRNRLVLTILAMVALIGSNAAWAQNLEQRVDQLYAEMNSQVMSANLNFINHYASNAIIIFDNGRALTPQELRELHSESIRRGGKFEVVQSKVLNIRMMATAVMGAQIAAVVISEDFVRFSHPNAKDSSKRETSESTAIVTRVLDLRDTMHLPVIVSEQSTEKKDTNKATP